MNGFSVLVSVKHKVFVLLGGSLHAGDDNSEISALKTTYECKCIFYFFSIFVSMPLVGGSP